MTSQSHTSRARRVRRGPRDRGVTLLEVVLSVVLLALASSALMSTVGYVRTLNAIEEQRLACAEIGNRLLLMKLDDEQSMPSRGSPIAYNGRSYRWSIEERPIRIDAREPARRQRVSGGTGLGRLRQLTVRVWLSEQSGGSSSSNAAVPTVELIRLYDPLLPSNPDTLNSMINSETGIDSFIQRLLESQAGSVGGNPSGAGSNSSGGGS